MKKFANGEAHLLKGNPVGSPVKWYKTERLVRNRKYAVNSNGSIFSLKTRKNGRYKRLTPKNNWDGYKRIQLWEGNSNEYVSIHILVAETFLTKTAEVVNHKDLDKGNNNVSNLEWITQQENIKHAMKHNPNASQNLNKVKVTNGVKTYNSITEAGKDVGRHPSSITKAIERGGKCAGYYWEPVSTNADECKRVE